jgi:DNA-binding SARP family transcriptional activator
MSRLALYLLGPPRIELDGEPIYIGRTKAVALLAYLAVTGTPHSREALATLLWPESTPSRARASLRRVLVTLRNALGEDWLDIQPDSVGIQLDAGLKLDVATFRDWLAACQAHDHPPEQVCPDCVPLLAAAVELYQDDFLAGFTLPDSLAFDEWQFFQAEGLRDELVGALERLPRWHSDQREHESAIAYARRWLELDPLHEPAHRQLMGLYSQAGRRNAALRQYRACVRVLEEELGVPPSAETTTLYEQIRRQRAGVAPAAVPELTPATRVPAFLTEEEERAVDRPIFVARERELARLDGYLDRAVAGQGQVVFVTGGPGRGKTALMREFAWRAMETHPELLVASGNCNAFSGVGDPYLPFREVLGMLTGDVEGRWAAGAISREGAQRLWAAVPLTARSVLDHGPYLIEALLSGPAVLARAMTTAAGNPEWLQELAGWVQRERASHSDLEQRAIFEQYTNVLCSLSNKQPLLLFLDDLQWADKGSIGMLFHLSRRVQRERILIVGAYRPEEVALPRDGEQHPLQKVVAETQRQFGDVWMDLTEVDQVEAYRFVEALLDTEPNRLSGDFCKALSRRTGGHPLFTVELLRTMQERGDLSQDADCAWVEGAALDWKTLPARVEAVIKARVDRLDDELRDLLAVASVEGETFTAQIVAQLQGLSEREVLHALSGDLGSRHRIVREAGEVQIGVRYLSRYQFSHALFQAYLYEALGPGERRLLHGEVGVALERLYDEQAEELAVQLAHHFGEAGRPEKAAAYARCAGDQARLAYANEEVIAYYQQVVALLDPSALQKPLDNLRLAALRGLGQVYVGLGKFADAERYSREALGVAKELRLAPRELVRILFWLGEAVFWQARYDELNEIAKEGLALLEIEAAGLDATASTEETVSVELALMLGLLAVSHGNRGNREGSRDCTSRLARFLTRLPYREELRPSFTLVAERYINDGRAEEATEWVRALEKRATEHHDLRALAAASFFEGMILLEQGDYSESVACYQQALERFIKIGDFKHECWCLLLLTWALLHLGDLDRAAETMPKALDLAKELGRRSDLSRALTYFGLVAYRQGAPRDAIDMLQEAIRLRREAKRRALQAYSTYLLGQVYLAQGDSKKALAQFQDALGLVRLRAGLLEMIVFPLILSGLEQAYDNREAFRGFCSRFRAEYPEAEKHASMQWHLEPDVVVSLGDTQLADVTFGRGTQFVTGLGRRVGVVHSHRDEQQTLEADPHVDTFAGTPLSDSARAPSWVWEDPFGDCMYKQQDGLEIRAANGRDLATANVSAPRLMRPLPQGTDWAAQIVCGPASDEKPAIGGLLVWRDRENYLRLDRGTCSERDISFQGRIGNEDVVIGRGMLKWTNSASPQAGAALGRVLLRMERKGNRVKALCSADGEEWYRVGEVGFRVDGPLQVGLYAIGNTIRTIHRNVPLEGTAIRFESFTLWGLDG